MNIERLEYFSTLAAYLNYSKAAKQLYISQPSLSKQISQLEKELGVPLFNRSRHMVALTPEGQECLHMVRALLHDYQQLKSWAEEKAASQAIPSIRIGYYGTLLKDIVLAVVEGFLTRQPNMDILLKNDSPYEVITALQNDVVDLAILRDGYCTSLKNLHREKVCTMYQYLLVPEHHPLARRSSVCLSELKNENFITLFQKDSPQGHDDMVLLCRKYGLEPKISHRCDDPFSYTMMFQSGQGLGIAHAYKNSFIAGIKFVSLTCRREDLTSDIMAVWKKEDRRTGGVLLTKTIRDICRQIPDLDESPSGREQDLR